MLLWGGLIFFLGQLDIKTLTLKNKGVVSAFKPAAKRSKYIIEVDFYYLQKKYKMSYSEEINNNDLSMGDTVEFLHDRFNPNLAVPVTDIRVRYPYIWCIFASISSLSIAFFIRNYKKYRLENK